MLDNFLLTINAILPLFLILLLGFSLRGPLELDDAFLVKANRLAFRVFLPTLLFYNVYSSDFSIDLSGSVAIFTVGAVLAVYLLSTLLTLFVEKQPEKRGVMIQGMFRSNFVLLGLPMASALSGNGTVELVSLMMAVCIPLYNVLAVLTLEHFRGRHRSFLGSVQQVFKNPLILAVLIGLLLKLLGLRLPQVLESPVKTLANVATGLMLFIMGASLKVSAIRSNVRNLSLTIFVRLVVVPALCLTSAYFLGFCGPAFTMLLALFATPPAAASYTMAQQMGGDPDLASEIVVFGTAVSCVTLFAWTFLFKQLGAF